MEYLDSLSNKVISLSAILQLTYLGSWAVEQTIQIARVNLGYLGSAILDGGSKIGTSVEQQIHC